MKFDLMKDMLYVKAQMKPRLPHVISNKNKIGARSIHGKVLSGWEFRENRRSRLHLGKKMLLCPHFPHCFARI